MFASVYDCLSYASSMVSLKIIKEIDRTAAFIWYSLKFEKQMKALFVAFAATVKQNIWTCLQIFTKKKINK